MTAEGQAKEQLERYQRYLGIAREVTNSEVRAAYEGLARQALLYAAKLDPAALEFASAITITEAKLSLTLAKNSTG